MTKKIHALLGIDDVLASALTRQNQAYFAIYVEYYLSNFSDSLSRFLTSPEEVREFDNYSQYYHWILENKLTILKLDNDDVYLVHHGVSEFLHYLYYKLETKISFFNDGEEKTNKEIVTRLLEASLNEAESKNEIMFYSKEYFTPVKEKSVSFFTPVIRKKDLEKVVTEENITVSIDNRIKHIDYHKQARNILHTDGICEREFIFPQDEDELIRKGNHIFYVTGLLKNAMTHVEEDYLVDSLSQLQVDLDELKQQEKLRKTCQYYRDGLAELQKINPRLQFFGGTRAEKYFKKTAELTEKSLHEGAKQHMKRKKCVIM